MHSWTFRDSEGNERRWECEPHPGEEGFELMATLSGIIAMGSPVIGGLRLSSIRDQGLDIDLDAEAIARGVDGLFAKLHEKGALDIARRLLRYSTRDGLKFAYSANDRGSSFFSFNQAFARNYGELRHALFEIASYNFKSFFGGFAQGSSE